MKKISFIQNIKTDEEIFKTQHTNMRFYIDGGIIICKNDNDIYTFMKVDNIEAFNFNMPIETSYVEPIKNLDEKYSNDLEVLVSFDNEFISFFNVVSIISKNLIFKHPLYNTYYCIDLSEFDIISKSNYKTEIISDILTHNQRRDILSPYKICFIDDDLLVC